MEKCQACNGTGGREHTCPICNGTGKILATNNGRDQIQICPMCRGSRKKRETCTWCNGTGVRQ